MADSKSRSRVERLIRGEFRNDDLMNLFLFTRDHCDGRASVKEIGNFVAHHSDRYKGVVTETARDWFAIARFHTVSLAQIGAVNPMKLPTVTPRYLSATLARLTTEQIRERCGLSRKDAHKLLPVLIAKLTKNKDGTYAANQNYSAREAAMFNGLCGILVTRPAFDGTELFRDFSAALKSNGLLLRDEMAALQARKPTIELFAVATMQNCRVEIENGFAVRLKASSQGGTSIVVNPAIPTVENSHILISSAIFTTELIPADHCEPDLLEMAEWDADIELTRDGRLGLLR